MGLERETELRMRECFAGQACCKCSQPAARFARGRFYCHGHFPYGRPAAAPGRKTYRHPRWAKGVG